MKKDKEICSAYSGNHKVFLQDLIESSAISAEILDYTLNFDKYSACLSHKVLTEKAYDIEAKTRILLNHALNALNFSYDSSMLYEPLSNMYNKIESEKAYSIEKDLLNAEKYFKENQYKRLW